MASMDFTASWSSGGMIYMQPAQCIILPSGDFYFKQTSTLYKRSDLSSQVIDYVPNGYEWTSQGSMTLAYSDDDVGAWSGAIVNKIGTFYSPILRQGETFNSAGEKVPFFSVSEIRSIVSVEELSSTVQASYTVCISIVIVFLSVLLFRWCRQLLKNAVNSAG